MGTKRILTGLQPTGALHIGNYFGAVRQMVELQEVGELYFFIADLHALTDLSDERTQQSSAQRQENSRHLLAASIALGIDPKRTIVYRQSDFPQITELMWIISCMLKHTFLTTGHAYKDAVQEQQDVGLGVFLYPALMAADILIANAEIVPVGQDQAQHVELTREMARKFNHIAGEAYFTEPQEQIQQAVAVIPGLDGKKMSKSKGNTLPIFADEEVLRKQIMSIVTDSTPQGEPINPETCLPCVYLEKIMPQEEYGTIANRCTTGNISYKELKELLVEQYGRYFKDAREQYEKLIDDKKHLEKVLERNRKHLDAHFTKQLTKVKQVLGVLSGS
ncbi:MAG: tryptophan--tRNA ligase [Candidatus Kaiserbacteria bacterium]|nr:tryptophan--tRNA ligase [Candidatus Kaiserbacteria bacterium]